ncbi:copper amine oxidase [Acinetobacter johnsonii]|uniref:copper amine oxidase n=1 Tax=Acinetobacter johnsonii TaxID=40214 RepID=UPI00191FEC64|nr:hypothetical protein [Acinetobacter johnsonii]QQV07923.1 hypothetical protein I6I49_01045 [Acinetobacter johnsonii]
MEACREANGATGRFWKIINPNVKNHVGNHPGYKLVAEHNPIILAHPNSSIGRRAGFAQKHLWVTPYAEKERYGSGEYPNQNYGDGLPVWVQQNARLKTPILLFGIPLGIPISVTRRFPSHACAVCRL